MPLLWHNGALAVAVDGLAAATGHIYDAGLFVILVGGYGAIYFLILPQRLIAGCCQNDGCVVLSAQMVVAMASNCHAGPFMSVNHTVLVNWK